MDSNLSKTGSNYGGSFPIQSIIIHSLLSLNNILRIFPNNVFLSTGGLNYLLASLLLMGNPPLLIFVRTQRVQNMIKIINERYVNLIFKQHLADRFVKFKVLDILRRNLET